MAHFRRVLPIARVRVACLRNMQAETSSKMPDLFRGLLSICQSLDAAVMLLTIVVGIMYVHLEAQHISQQEIKEPILLLEYRLSPEGPA